MNPASLLPQSITYPIPGATRFECQLPEAVARFIASGHWDLVALHPAENCHHIESRSGFVGSVGTIGGRAAILNKLPSGERELLTF